MDADLVVRRPGCRLSPLVVGVAGVVRDHVVGIRLLGYPASWVNHVDWSKG